MRHAARKTGQAGFSLLELAVVAILFGILAAALLNRLSYYQEAAEKARAEYTISAMKSGLRHRMAELLIAGRAQEFHLLANGNPMDWMERKPDNYAGVVTVTAAEKVAAGRWYFDADARELVYLPHHAAHFRPDAKGRKQIRLRTVLKSNFASEGGEGAESMRATGGVALELVEAYFWF